VQGECTKIYMSLSRLAPNGLVLGLPNLKRDPKVAKPPNKLTKTSMEVAYQTLANNVKFNMNKKVQKVLTSLRLRAHGRQPAGQKSAFGPRQRPVLARSDKVLGTDMLPGL